MDKLNYPKKIKYTDLTIKPKKLATWLLWVVKVLQYILMGRRKLKITKIGMEGLNKAREPYLHLITHMQFLDFIVAKRATGPIKFGTIATIDGFDRMKDWLMRVGGVFPTRKFAGGANDVRRMLHVVKHHKVSLNVYPEAEYTPDGILSPIPGNMGKLAKMLKLPIVVLQTQGNYLIRPTWGDQKTIYEVPLHAVQKLILTKEEVETLPAEEIQKRIEQEMDYDEYRYWQNTGFKINYKNRAKGMHHFLYKCPACKVEFQMASDAAEIWCKACDVKHHLRNDGWLETVGQGKAYFAHVPDWVKWQREEVRKEIRAGTYYFKVKGPGKSLPDSRLGKKGVDIGEVELEHDMNGIRIRGHYNGQDFLIEKEARELYNVEVYVSLLLYKWPALVALSTEEDTIYCFTPQNGTQAKIQYAVREMYKLATK
ncbi:MAG: hypothetical protein FWE79_03245 [Firmicutes bacterium]|nr:hypothetical protein [Bacillota bacterium]